MDFGVAYMDENIKSARQAGILLILLLVFSFNLDSDLKNNLRKVKIIHGFLIQDAFSNPEKISVRAERSDSEYALNSIVQNTKTTLRKNGVDRSILSKITHSAIEERKPLEITLNWGYFDLTLYSTGLFVNGTKENNWTSTLTFSSGEGLDILLRIDTSSKKIANHTEIPIEEEKFNVFFGELVSNIDTYKIFIGDMSWRKDEFESGSAHAFYKANFNIDSTNINNELFKLYNKAMKGNVKLPIFDVVMNIEKAYAYLLTLVTILLVYLNGQLRLINSGLELDSFDKCSLTSWKVYAKTGYTNALTRYAEAFVALGGYSIAMLTPLFILGFIYYFYSEISENDLNVLLGGTVSITLMLLVILTSINIFQIFTKRYEVEAPSELKG